MLTTTIFFFNLVYKSTITTQNPYEEHKYT